MSRTFFAVAVIVLFASAVFAQQTMGAKTESGDSCLMYGKDHMFAIKAPTGWTVDAATGKKLGLHAVMYPQDSSWREAPATIYSNFVHKNPDLTTIEKIVADDIAGYKKDSPTVIIQDAEPLPLGAGKEKVLVKIYRGDKGNNFEEVAYIDESKVVIMLVLSARNEKEFVASLPLFKELVHSYRFISDTVTISQP